MEIILVDDGSSDSSGAICDAFAKKDDRVKVYHKPNGGVSSARNFGLEKASGEYITFVDSDDYILSDAVKKGGRIYAAICRFNLFCAHRKYVENRL